ncbi:hypothetical protein acdb102_20330 [Acidothermaceae bacterium B102]|nr:hypothetical protein acdb102_20330 [Acidothermaceae bacterium B102]
MGFRRDDDEPPREIDVSTPWSGDAAPLDALGHEPAPRRRGLAVVGLAALVAAGVTPVIVHHHQQDVLRHDRAAYEQLVSLSADGEAAVEEAVSQTRDVSQYAEPLLNSQLTSATTRTTLYRQVKAAQDASRAAIVAQRQRLADDKTTQSHRLKAARSATLAYLDGWSAMFSPPAGSGFAESTDDLAARHRAALLALQAAAPDQTLAAEAGDALGTTDVE